MGNEEHRQFSCEDVLMDFATAEPGPTAELLEDFVRRFPDYELALRELFAALSAEEAAEWPTEVPQARPGQSLADRVRSFGQFEAAPPRSKLPFEGSSPKELRRLTEKLNVSPLFLAKLKDRVIDARTMSDSFLLWLSGSLGQTADALRVYFQSDTRMAKGLAFKADSKPEGKTKQSFSEALETSGLTEEQKQMLRDVSARE
jgi:hypothetical protein